MSFKETLNIYKNFITGYFKVTLDRQEEIANDWKKGKIGFFGSIKKIFKSYLGK